MVRKRKRGKNKDVLITCQYFYPEENSSATLPYDTARFLAEQGYKVGVLCGYPKEYFNGDKVPYEEVVNGIRVLFTAADEPADIRMGKMTAEMKDRQVYAVSSDSLVQTDAWTHGALRISSREFLAMLERTEEEIRSRLS